MDFSRLTPAQLEIACSPLDSTIFLEGPAGSGKTSAGVHRMHHLIEKGVPAEKILVLVPQRTLAEPYYLSLRDPALPPGGMVTILTVGGLAQRSIDLFWPIVVRDAHFGRPTQPPHFLTLESAQFYLAGLVMPLLEKSYFTSITIDRNRLLSQVLDNLNKAAAVGFNYTEIGERLTAAWIGEPAQTRAYQEAQEAAQAFREFCLANNLLDFSLQLEVFHKFLWSSYLFRSYLKSSYRHLIFDNIEEDIPLAHDLMRDWLPDFDSALLIFDQDGGYRRFLGADSASGYSLRDQCKEIVQFQDSWVSLPEVQTLAQAFQHSFRRQYNIKIAPEDISAMTFQAHANIPEMADWVSGEIEKWVWEQSVSPGEIVVLAPFLSDSLRFSLSSRLEARGIPCRSHRPSRSLREEPATLAWLTIAKLAHPDWGMTCSRFEVRNMIMQIFTPNDLVRADLISHILFDPRRLEQGLKSFDTIVPEKQQRITYRIGEKWEQLRNWLLQYQSQPALELDVFISRLFGELLSQPEFGFHVNFDAASVTARLIESIRKFRQAVVVTGNSTQPIGQQYIKMVDQGIIAAQSLSSWSMEQPDSVLLAPAYTFLMSNRPATCQFWLDVGSSGWWERLYQPLTHPTVLSRQWVPGQRWTDVDEFQTNQETMERLVTGLLRRCRQHVYLNYIRMNERGEESRSNLLLAVQSLKRRSILSDEVSRD